MGSRTTTTKTELPPMSSEEASMLNLGINYLLSGPIQEQFFIKPVEKTKYKNQGLVDSLMSEKGRLDSELKALERRYESYTSGTPGTPGYASNQLKLREVESRIGTVNARLAKIDSAMQKESKDSTTFTDYQLMDKPPPTVQRLVMKLGDQDRARAENILQNYGYSSSQFRQFAKRTKNPGLA